MKDSILNISLESIKQGILQGSNCNGHLSAHPLQKKITTTSLKPGSKYMVAWNRSGTRCVMRIYWTFLNDSYTPDSPELIREYLVTNIKKNLNTRTINTDRALLSATFINIFIEIHKINMPNIKQHC